MSEITTEQALNVIEILKGLKTLLANNNPYLPIYSALGGAFIGAVATFIPTSIINWLNNKRERKSLTLAIYAEISATMELISARSYVESIETIIKEIESKIITESTYRVIVPEDYSIIYKSNVVNIGKLDPKLQIYIVNFYQLLGAAIQDIKPGGHLNESPRGIKSFQELLAITNKMISIGTKTIEEIEKNYNIKQE